MTDKLKVNGRTELYGILGKPVVHSLSPAIHNYAAESLGLNICYVPLSVETDNCKQLLGSLWDLGFKGVNITGPFKESVAKLFPDSGILSVNTLLRSKDCWKAFSTDGAGFILSLEHLGYDPRKFDAVVCLGNGGASLSVIKEWLSRFPETSMSILRRSVDKDERFLQGMNDRSRIEFYDFEPQALKRILDENSSCNILVIQSTSAPLFGDNLNQFSNSILSLNGLFVDMLYGDSASSLLSTCKSKNIPCADGLGMLIGQAIEAQKIWWGQSGNWESIEAMLRDKIEV